MELKELKYGEVYDFNIGNIKRAVYLGISHSKKISRHIIATRSEEEIELYSITSNNKLSKQKYNIGKFLLKREVERDYIDSLLKRKGIEVISEEDVVI